MLAIPLLVSVLTVLVVRPAQGQSNWESYKTESYALAPRESFQFHIEYDQIKVRSWRLVVDGGQENCDLSVLRVRDESLLYGKNDESRHDVLVPWGRGEEIIVVISNRTRPAAFTVALLGPPRDQIHASYGYHVNRALEAYAAGRRPEAEAACRSALLDDPQDGVAKVLLAGFLRDGHYLSQAIALVDEALAGELPGEMHTLAKELRADLGRLRAPLPAPVSQAQIDVEARLGAGDAAGALTDCARLLKDGQDLDAASRGALLTLKGRALADLSRNFEAIDAYTQALAAMRDRGDAAVVYYHMGRLHDTMDNAAQADGAYEMALQYGLPSGLAAQTRDALQALRERQPVVR